MALIKTKEEISVLREGGRRLAEVLREIIKAARPGVSTLELDQMAENLILKVGGTPAFKGYKIKETKIPYPGAICASINDEIVHGIPSAKRILQKGDILGIDIGMKYPAQGGLFTDMAETVGIGEISDQASNLLKETKASLSLGIKEVRAGIRIGNIGSTIQKHLEKNNFGVIRDLAGHGVGHKLHEEPLIPNFGNPGAGTKLEKNMVIAIEPMATLGDWEIQIDQDEWTFRTADGSLAAHFEHTVLVKETGAEILTML